MSFNVFRENKILAKISKFTVFSIGRGPTFSLIIYLHQYFVYASNYTEPEVISGHLTFLRLFRK